MDRKPSVLVSSMALFSMFFGAGNLIFPPFLGHISGTQYLASMIGFLLTGVGLVHFGVVATSKSGGGINDIGLKVGNGFATLFALLIILCIGPGLAIPRTAATTYEIIQGSLLPELNPIISSIIFFSIVIAFVLKPNNVIDAVGKYLTPVLLTVLVIIIVKGLISPIDAIVKTDIINPFGIGFLEGYQTMDALAALVFASVVINDFKNKGVSDENELIKLTTKSMFIAAIGLCIVYGGLLYIGAQTSSQNLQDLDKVKLLIHVTDSLLGNLGKYILAITMAFACITTAIGLTSTVGNFFFELFKGKINRTVIVLISTLFSGFFAVNGVESIVSISAPVLSMLYPVAIVLIFFNMFPNKFNKKSTYRGAVLGAFIPTIFMLLGMMNIEIAFISNMKNMIPSFYHNFLWIIPAALLGVLFTVLDKSENI